MMKTTPAVFAVADEYQIMVQIDDPVLFSVRVGDEEYFDESNGIMRSLSELHRVRVPMAELDRAKEYTVCIRPLLHRKPYFTTTAPLETFTFPFMPVPERNIRAYHISDAHNRIDGPVAAARAFGAFDFLILNGDIIDHSGDPSKFDNIYRICAELTGGSKPVVFSRGNHDMRGNYAEKFAEYTPNHNGNTYYTFRLGTIWGILMDCGEDKVDDCPEYGHTVACHAFRRRQTAFLKRVIADCKNEYEAEGVRTRLVISHVPFSYVHWAPFDIERDVYFEWCALLREYVKPDVMICGHMHDQQVWNPGWYNDHLGQPAPVVIGGNIKREDFSYFAGCGFIFNGSEVQAVFNDSTGTALNQIELHQYVRGPFSVEDAARNV